MTNVCHLRSDIATRGGSRPGSSGPDPFVARSSKDHAIADLAARQHGVVAHRQLLALGLNPGGIKHRVAAGRLHRVHVGVFAVGHRLLTANGVRTAAVLACGPDAVLSHRDVAHLWGLRPCSRMTTDVTTTRRARSRPDLRALPPVP